MGNCRVSTLRAVATVTLLGAAKLHQIAFPQAEAYQVQELPVGTQYYHYDQAANPNYVDMYEEEDRELWGTEDEVREARRMMDRLRAAGRVMGDAAKAVTVRKQQQTKVKEVLQPNHYPLPSAAQQFQSAFENAIATMPHECRYSHNADPKNAYLPAFMYHTEHGMSQFNVLGRRTGTADNVYVYAVLVPMPDGKVVKDHLCMIRWVEARGADEKVDPTFILFSRKPELPLTALRESDPSVPEITAPKAGENPFQFIDAWMVLPLDTRIGKQIDPTLYEDGEQYLPMHKEEYMKSISGAKKAQRAFKNALCSIVEQRGALETHSQYPGERTLFLPIFEYTTKDRQTQHFAVFGQRIMTSHALSDWVYLVLIIHDYDHEKGDAQFADSGKDLYWLRWGSATAGLKAERGFFRITEDADPRTSTAALRNFIAERAVPEISSVEKVNPFTFTQRTFELPARNCSPKPELFMNQTFLMTASSAPVASQEGREVTEHVQGSAESGVDSHRGDEEDQLLSKDGGDGKGGDGNKKTFVY